MTWWHVCLLCPHRRRLLWLDIHRGCLNIRLLYWCLDDRLLERCLDIRLLKWCLHIWLLGGDGHRLLARSRNWLPCLKRHWRLLGRLACWLLSHHHWLLRGHEALHGRSCLSPLEGRHLRQPLQLLLRCPRLLLRCQ